jgi:hypothetical protein
MYVTRRKDPSDPWGEAVNLGPAVNSPDSEYNPGISPDGHMLYFVRDHDIWQAPIVNVESNSDPNNRTSPGEQLKQSAPGKEVMPQQTN